jgi:hypothetical protein
MSTVKERPLADYVSRYATMEKSLHYPVNQCTKENLLFSLPCGITRLLLSNHTG